MISTAVLSNTEAASPTPAPKRKSVSDRLSAPSVTEEENPPKPLPKVKIGETSEKSSTLGIGMPFSR